MTAKLSKAFNYEEGQFICHTYSTISIDDHQVLEDVIKLVQAEQAKGASSGAFEGWAPQYQDNCQTRLHLTLLRGHRAVYYHQIKALIAELRSKLQHLAPLSLCLDKLVVFSNHEGNKQFLCLAAQSVISNKPLDELKQILRDTIDQYATRLTTEDETQDTSAHCSLMFRDIKSNSTHNSPDDLDIINKVILSELNDLPMCLVLIDTVEVKIGNHVYMLKLAS